MEGDLQMNVLRLDANFNPDSNMTIDNFLNMMIEQAIFELEARGYSNIQPTVKTYTDADIETGKRTVTVEVVGSRIKKED